MLSSNVTPSPTTPCRCPGFWLLDYYRVFSFTASEHGWLLYSFVFSYTVPVAGFHSHLGSTAARSDAKLILTRSQILGKLSTQVMGHIAKGKVVFNQNLLDSPIVYPRNF